MGKQQVDAENEVPNSACSVLIFSVKQDLRTGTYGPKALKEIPKPKAMRKKKKKRRAQSKESLLSDDSLDSGSPGPGLPPRPPGEARLYERRGAPRPGDGGMERIAEEPPEYNGRAGYPTQPGAYYDVPPPQQQQQQPAFYSDQPGMGVYYDNAPAPASPYVPDPDGYYMQAYPQQAPPRGQPPPRPGLEESAF